MAEDAREDAPGDAPAGARGGAWLTYRYRLGGEGVAEAAGATTGTMKAPSFLSAARRILARLAARGPAGALGVGPVYLRLRAAGEEEVLLRAVRADAGAEAAWQVEVVPAGSFAFTPSDVR